jgi:8-oxo-dGTP diphosphatase
MLICTFEDGGTGSKRHVVTDNIVLRGDEVLLVKRSPRLSEGGKWGSVGGFMDRDETMAECVRREILEETGYTVTDITLFRIVDSPNRRNDQDRQNVSFVHFCNAGEKVGEADDESTEQKWFPLSALPPREEFAFDHYDNIELYLQYRKEAFPLPRTR